VEQDAPVLDLVWLAFDAEDATMDKNDVAMDRNSVKPIDSQLSTDSDALDSAEGSGRP
jgi:hypothetical protein